MIRADETREVKQNSMHKETDFQSNTGSNKMGDTKQGEPRKILKLVTSGGILVYYTID